MEHYKLYINGKFIDSSSNKTFESINPATEEPWATIAEAKSQDVNNAVEAAHNAFHGEWSSFLPNQRGEFLRAIGDQLKQNAELLGTIETRDTGKMFKETKFQANYIAEFYYYYAGLADKIEGSTLPIDKPDMQVFTTREPVGVVAAVIPWNSQQLLSAIKLAPALAMGNTIIIKASETAPTPLLELAKLIDKVGLPKGVVNIIAGFADECSKVLTSHKKINRIAFTGGMHTAKHIVRNSAENLSQVTLELGGKSPLIIFDDADIDNAISGALLANFYTQGEVCTNGTRVFVQEGIYDQFIEKICECSSKIKLGDPMNLETQMGALISAEHLDKVMSYIDKAKSSGARLVYGGNRHNSIETQNGFFVEPTIFADCEDDSPNVTDEIFGPVMSVLSFENETEVIARANDTRFGLAAGVFTKDISRAHRVINQLQAGICWINSWGDSPAEMPVGGYKESGIGRENGPETLKSYTQVKSIFIRLDDLENPY